MLPRLCLTLILLFVLSLCAGCPKPSPDTESAATPTPSSRPQTPTPEPAGGGDSAAPGTAVEWALTSSAFEDDQPIPAMYTADGDDVSPPLAWTEPPAGTAQLALVCDDPDAPGGAWVHWVLYGLPSDTRELPEGVPAEGVVTDLGGAKQGRNGFTKIGYGGPAPPAGAPHHYGFTLYALSAELDLEAGATADDLRTAMQGNVLAKTQLVGTYGR